MKHADWRHLITVALIGLMTGLLLVAVNYGLRWTALDR